MRIVCFSSFRQNGSPNSLRTCSTQIYVLSTFFITKASLISQVHLLIAVFCWLLVLSPSPETGKNMRKGPPPLLRGMKSGSICSCQVKSYNVDDPATWERPTYVHLHDASAPCCATAIHDVEIAEPELPASQSTSGRANNKRPSPSPILDHASLTQASPRSYQYGTTSSPNRNHRPKRQQISTIATSSFYDTAKNGSNRNASSARPYIVNGKLVPTRLSNLETHVAKSLNPGRPFMDMEDLQAADEEKSSDFMSERRIPRTYSRVDRRRYSGPNHDNWNRARRGGLKGGSAGWKGTAG